MVAKTPEPFSAQQADDLTLIGSKAIPLFLSSLNSLGTTVACTSWLSVMVTTLGTDLGLNEQQCSAITSALIKDFSRKLVDATNANEATSSC